jgi:hypothetical protein
MLKQLTGNKLSILIPSGAGLALVQALSLMTITKMPFGVLFPDSLIHTFSVILLAIPLISVLTYGNLESILLPVRIVVYVMLAIFALAMSAGALYGIELLLFNDNFREELLALIPLRILLTGLMLSICVMLKNSLYNWPSENQLVEEMPETNNEEAIEAPEATSTGAKEIIDHIAVKNGTKIHVVSTDEIICLMADGDYVQVITPRGKFLKEQTMKYFEEHLPANRFVRVHRSCIVNTTAISRIELYEKQTQQLLLSNGEKIKTSINGYKNLKKALNI